MLDFLWFSCKVNIPYIHGSYGKCPTGSGLRHFWCIRQCQKKSHARNLSPDRHRKPICKHQPWMSISLLEYIQNIQQNSIKVQSLNQCPLENCAYFHISTIPRCFYHQEFDKRQLKWSWLDSSWPKTACPKSHPITSTKISLLNIQHSTNITTQFKKKHCPTIPKNNHLGCIKSRKQWIFTISTGEFTGFLWISGCHQRRITTQRYQKTGPTCKPVPSSSLAMALGWPRSCAPSRADLMSKLQTWRAVPRTWPGRWCCRCPWEGRWWCLFFVWGSLKDVMMYDR